MEKFHNKYKSEPVDWPDGVDWEIAGVVGSGNLEVLVERGEDRDHVVFSVETSIDGFRKAWEASFADFAHHRAIGGTKVTIHDQGAVPAVVQLRLRQALDKIGTVG